METNEDRRWCVYMHINKINHKIYIGQTCQKPEYRWSNGNGYKECPCFYNAIQKYGWDGFEHIIFADSLTIDEANHMEELLIALYDTTNRDNGYNLTSGGENNICSEETKEKMRISHKGVFAGEKNPMFGRRYTDEERRIKSEQMSGPKNPNYGKSLTEEHKQILRESARERLKDPKNHPMYGTSRSGENAAFTRKVIRLIDGRVYFSEQMAADDTGVNRNTIRKRCGDHVNFMFYDEYAALKDENPKLLDEYIKNSNDLTYIDQSGENAPSAKKVIRLYDEKLYGYLLQAAKDNNMSSVTLRKRCLEHNGFMYYDYYLYLKDNDKLLLEKYKNDSDYNNTCSHPGEKAHNARKVIRLSDSKIYGWLDSAVQDNNLSKPTMIKYCKNRNGFMYYDEWLTEQND